MFKMPNNIKKIINQEIPEQLIKQRPGGGGVKLSYISGSTVIDTLNNAFNYMWNWKIEREWIQESQPRYNKYTKKVEPQGPVAHVCGTLTVFIQQENEQIFSLSKTAYGSKSIIGGQSDQESIFKAASTDALKKAASMLGIGLSLYRNEDEQYYFNEVNNSNAWTNKNVATHKSEIEFIADFRNKHNIDDEKIVEILQQFSNNTLFSPEDIVPDNISDFVEYLKQIEESVA